MHSQRAYRFFGKPFLLKKVFELLFLNLVMTYKTIIVVFLMTVKNCLIYLA